MLHLYPKLIVIIILHSENHDCRFGVVCFIVRHVFKLIYVFICSFFCVFFLQRETIVKLVSIERGDSFCYVVVSKGGRVGIYSGLLKLMCSYEV